MYPGQQYHNQYPPPSGGYMPMPSGPTPPPSGGAAPGGMPYPMPEPYPPSGGGTPMYFNGYPLPSPSPISPSGTFHSTTSTGSYPPPLPARQPGLPPRQQSAMFNRPPLLVPGGGAHWGSFYQQGMNVTLSQCTGRKRALLIGINYIGQRHALKGCINDVLNIKRFITEFYNFRECDMVVLTDNNPDPRCQPTRANIIRAMHWLVANARANDSFFFHFSGHGSQVVDTSGDEIDGYDETILPVDHRTTGQIVDDDMNSIMVRPLPPGARLTAIFDSCHSGTALDLPFVYDHQGRLVQNQIAEVATQSIFKAGSSYMSGDIVTAGKSVFSGLKALISGPKIQQRQMQLKGSMGDVIMFSGCKDSQTSADTFNYTAGNTGAMSHAFVTVLSRNPHQTYSQLLHNIREYLRGRYSQVPQLSSGRYMDMNQYFIM
ncbi:Ca(2+)-dependent cysteine protease [Dispira simplex]|nr:Ca(2+)-dependent cysteine protease [Dispira simplex]